MRCVSRRMMVVSAALLAASAFAVGRYVTTGTVVGIDTPSAGVAVATRLEATVLDPAGQPVDATAVVRVRQASPSGRVATAASVAFIANGALSLDVWPRDAFNHTMDIEVIVAGSGPAPENINLNAALFGTPSAIRRGLAQAVTVDFSSTSTHQVSIGTIQLANAPSVGAVDLDDLDGTLAGTEVGVSYRRVSDGWYDHNAPGALEEDDWDVLGGGPFHVGTQYQLYSWAPATTQWQLNARSHSLPDYVGDVVVTNGNTQLCILTQFCQVSGSISAAFMNAGAFYVILKPTGGPSAPSPLTGDLEFRLPSYLVEVDHANSSYRFDGLPKDTYDLLLLMLDMRTVIRKVDGIACEPGTPQVIDLQ